MRSPFYPLPLFWSHFRPASDISQMPRGESDLSSPSLTMFARAQQAVLRQRGVLGSEGSGFSSTGFREFFIMS
jgi:hypothetical protein